MPARATKNPAPALPSFEPEGGTLARIVHMAAVGMVVADIDGRMLYGNRAFGALLGHDIDAAAAEGLLTLIHPGDDTAARQKLGRLMRGEISEHSGEHRLCHADGSARWVAVAASMLPGETADAPHYLIVQLSDNERQKQAEETLSYAEHRWRFALESARQGVWDHDGRADTMYYSTMWRTLRGLPPNEPVPEAHEATWLARIHPDDRQRVIDNITAMDAGAGSDEIEYRERKPDGSYMWVLARGRPVEWDENGKPLRTIGTDTDITRLKTFEMELAAEKERLRVTLDSIADGMIATDDKGRVMFMNPAAELLTGYGSQEAMGRDVNAVFAMRDGTTGERQDCPVAACLGTDAPAHRDDDVILVSQGGVERDIRCTASPVRMPNGKTTGTVLVFQDVTQSRAMQRELTHSANHDDLTGLPNRAAFDRALNADIAAARDGRHRHCLLYIDLDRFKPVNDTAGHAAGDALLKQVAQTIRGSCRGHDMAARIGGDEFAVLLRDCPADSGRAVADKIVRAISSLMFDWAGKTYRIGASVGMTTIDGEPASGLGFMGEADAACYAAKARGRGMAIAFRDI